MRNFHYVAAAQVWAATHPVSGCQSGATEALAKLPDVWPEGKAAASSDLKAMQVCGACSSATSCTGAPTPEEAAAALAGGRGGVPQCTRVLSCVCACMCARVREQERARRSVCVRVRMCGSRLRACAGAWTRACQQTACNVPVYMNVSVFVPRTLKLCASVRLCVYVVSLCGCMRMGKWDVSLRHVSCLTPDIQCRQCIHTPTWVNGQSAGDLPTNEAL